MPENESILKWGVADGKETQGDAEWPLANASVAAEKRVDEKIPTWDIYMKLCSDSW